MEKVKTTLQQDIHNNPNSQRLQNLLEKMDDKMVELMKKPGWDSLKKAAQILARKKEIQAQIEINNSAAG